MSAALEEKPTPPAPEKRKRITAAEMLVWMSVQSDNCESYEGYPVTRRAFIWDKFDIEMFEAVKGLVQFCELNRDAIARVTRK